MALSQPTLKTDILAMLNATNNLELESAKNAFADQLATAIIVAIAQAVVTIPPGAILTTGTATNQSNLAPAIGSLS